MSGGITRDTDDARGLLRGVRLKVVVANGRIVDEEVVCGKSRSNFLCWDNADRGGGGKHDAD